MKFSLKQTILSHISVSSLCLYIKTSWVCRATLEFNYRLGLVGVGGGLGLGLGWGKNLGPDKKLEERKHVGGRLVAGWLV